MCHVNEGYVGVPVISNGYVGVPDVSICVNVSHQTIQML